MAHAAQLQDLTRKLVGGVILEKVDNARIAVEAFKRLKDTTHSRVNPFEVEAQLSGLVEKFSIVNRDDLSDSLQACLDQLSLREGWIPEVLSLLLELSDRPATQDLTTLAHEDASTTHEAWSWDDILALEPVNDDGVWDDVERGYHSSGDDRSDADELASEHTGSTEATSVGDNDATVIARSYIVQPDFGALGRLEGAKACRSPGRATTELIPITELAMIRSTLDMLLGLPTATYDLDAEDGNVKTGTQCNLTSASSSSTNDLRSQLVQIALQIQELRLWTKVERNTTLLQAIQSAVQVEVQRFDHEIQHLLHRFLQPTGRTVVSMLEVETAVNTAAQHVVPLAGLITSWREDVHQRGTQLLQDLYDATCRAHLIGDGVSLDTLGAVFLRGVHAYLTSVRKWMTSGSVPKEEIFFVQMNDEHCPVGRLWRDRYSLRKHDDDRLCAPAFLLPLVDDIFATGKSRSLLDLIGNTSEYCGTQSSSSTLDLITMGHIRARLAVQPLSPVQEIFQSALRTWTSSVASQTVEDLGRAISEQSELWLAVEALRPVFFASDGYQFTSFSYSLFGAITDAENDAFMLTKLAQTSFGTADTVDASRVVVSVQERETQSSSIGVLERVELQYNLPWLLQNIAQKERLTLHPRIFTLLLQCQHSLEQIHSTFADLRCNGLPTGTLLKLRSCLLWFSNIWFSHVASTASLLHTELLVQLKGANGIDSMASAWSAYEQRLELVLLLSGRCKPVYNAMIGVLELCERFSGSWHRVPSEDDEQLGQPSLGCRGSEPGRLLDEFERSISFIQAGIRSISRAAGEASLETLSFALNWRDEA